MTTEPKAVKLNVNKFGIKSWHIDTERWPPPFDAHPDHTWWQLGRSDGPAVRFPDGIRMYYRHAFHVVKGLRGYHVGQ